MAPYLCLNILLVMLCVLGDTEIGTYRIRIKHYKLCTVQSLALFIAAVSVALFMGFRGGFTTDYRNYEELFKRTRIRSFQDIIFNRSYVERGYLLFNKVVGFFTGNSKIWMCVTSIVFVALVVVNYKQYNRGGSVYFILLFVNAGIYFFAFNLVRQALAASIVFVALRMLGDGNIKGYIVTVLLAMTIHISAISMLCALPLLRMKVNFKNSLLMIGIGVVVTLSIDKIIEFVQKYRYENYRYGMGNGTVNAYLLQWTLCAFAAFTIYKGAIDIKDKTNAILINSTWLYLIFSVATLKVYQMSRLCYFFSTPMIILVNQSIEKLKGRNRKILKCGLTGVLILYSYVWLSGTGYEPYYTFFR